MYVELSTNQIQPDHYNSNTHTHTGRQIDRHTQTRMLIVCALCKRRQQTSILGCAFNAFSFVFLAVLRSCVCVCGLSFISGGLIGCEMTKAPQTQIHTHTHTLCTFGTPCLNLRADAFCKSFTIRSDKVWFVFR